MAASDDKKIITKTPVIDKKITKKHLARLERERIQTRYILIGSIIVLIAVFGLVGYGILDQVILRPYKPVAVVKNDKITTREWQDLVRYQRSNLVNQYVRTVQLMQSFGGGIDLSSYFNQNLQQIQFQLDVTTAGQNALDSLIEDRIIRQEAARLGITVTKEEVDQAFQEAFGFYPDGASPTPTEIPTTLPTATLSSLQLTLLPPTSTATATSPATATSTPTGTLTSTLTPTTILPTPTSTITPTATAGPSPTPEPTATPYTLDLYNKDYKSYVEGLKTEINFSEAEFRKIFESELYRKKISEAITGNLPRTEEKVWARHILVANEDVAKTVKARLGAGESFSTLAAEYSTDTSNSTKGGDLGWFGKGKMVAEFETAAYALEIGQISDPVQSQFGWHVIQVLGHGDRPLSAGEYDTLRNTKFQEWLDSQRKDLGVVTYDTWKDIIPEEPIIPPNMLQPAATQPISLPVVQTPQPEATIQP